MSQLTVLKKMKISEMPVLQNMKKKNNSLFCKIEIYQSITDSCPAKNKQISTHCFAKYKNIRVSQFIVLQNIKHQNYLFSKYKNIRNLFILHEILGIDTYFRNRHTFSW